MPRPSRPADVAIHFDGGDPMRGSVALHGKRRVERFVGWLALMSALERIFRDTPAPDPSAGLTTRKAKK